MMLFATLLAMAGSGAAAGASPLDPFMLDVTEACLLPNLETNDPRSYFSSHGWVWAKDSESFSRTINGANYIVRVAWPASKGQAAACSFETDDVAVVDVYDWLKRRIGKPRDIAWTTKQIGGWKIETNSHDAGVYLSRKNDSTKRAGMMLHVLQN